MSKRNQFLAQYGDSDHIHKAIESDNFEDGYDRSKHALNNPRLDKTHLSKLISSDSSNIAAEAAKHPLINDEHVATIMADPRYYSRHVKLAILSNENIKQSAIKKAYDNGNEETKTIIGTHPSIQKDLRQHILKNTNNQVVKDRINQNQANDDKLDAFMDSIKDHPLLK